MSEARPPASSDPRGEFEQAARAPSRAFVAEFWQFARENKRWWLTPILVTLMLISLLVVLGSTGAGPFVYSLF